MALSLTQIKKIMNPVKNKMPSNDFRIIKSWAEYEDGKGKSGKLEYMCFEFEVMDPETGKKSHLFKAIKFVRVIRLPKSAKQSTSFMDMQTQVLTAVNERGYNLITVIANIVDPVSVGLLYLYGLQGVADTIEDAKSRAKSDFLGFVASMQGTFRVLHMQSVTAEESEWLRHKMNKMEYMTAVRGIPKANTAGEDMGNKGMGGSNLNPDSQGTLEELITAMADYEYVIEILSTPVYRSTLEAWANKTEKQMTEWNSQLQGTKSLSFSVSIPMMYMASTGTNQGWSKNYTDSNSVSYSNGDNYSTGYSQNVGESVSHSLGESFGLSQGTSQTNSVGQSHSVSNSMSYGQNVGYSEGLTHGQTLGQTQGITQGQTVGYSKGISVGTSSGISIGNSTGQSIGSSVGNSNSISLGQSMSSNMGQSFSQGINQGQSQTTSDSMNMGRSYGENIGNSFNASKGESTGLSHNLGSSLSSGYGTSENVNLGNSANYGESAGQNIGAGMSSNAGTGLGKSATTGVNGNQTQGGNVGANAGIPGVIGGNASLSGSNSVGQNANTGTTLNSTHGAGASANAGASYGQNVGKGESIGYGSGYSTSHSGSTTESYGVSNGQSYSQGYGASYGQNSGLSYSNGQSVSNGETLGKSQSLGATESMGKGASYGASQGNTTGQSASDSVSISITQNKGTSTSSTMSQNVSASTSVSNSVSKSESLSNSYTNSYGKSQSQSQGVSDGTSTSQSYGKSESESYTQSVSDGTGQSWGESNSVSQGKSYSESNGRSIGNSIGSTGGYSQGTSGSMGLSPSIGYNKSYQWLDQQVKDILELLEYQNERLKKALNGQGAFYTYCYIACPDEDALACAQAAAKSTWQNEYALTNPLQVLDLTPEEQSHLLYHFTAFSTDITRENVHGVSEYKYATVLLPNEYVAYTHLPRVSEGGIDTNINDIPKFRVPGNMKGCIYMGTVLNSERYTFQNGYRTKSDYRIDIDELMHGMFVGQSRSGKTVAAMRFVKELANARRTETGKRLRIVCLDPKQDWRGIARFVEPERFRFYSLGNALFRPINLNICKIPKGVQPQYWIDGIINIYCRSYGLLERGKQMLSEAFYSLYEEAGIFKLNESDPDWMDKATELSASITFAKVYQWMETKKNSFEDPSNTKNRVGNDTRDAYARLLERLQCFARPYSIERRLFSKTSEDSKNVNPGKDNFIGVGTGLGVDELIGADDVTVFESFGLESTFASFVFGVLTSGFYKVAKGFERGFLHPTQYETVLVIEEANKVLTGSDTAGTGGGQSASLSGQSEFEEILDQAAGYGLFIIAITQKPSMMPSSIIANCGLLFIGKLANPDDVNLAVRMMGREERIEDRDVVKWLPASPTGWFICRSSRGYDFRNAEPVLVQIAPLNNAMISNRDLDALLYNAEMQKVLSA